MGLRLFASILLGFFLSTASLAAGPVYDVVFDVDWSLFYPLKAAVNSQSVQVGGEFYQPADQVIETLIQLHQDGHRVSIFSGGKMERNGALVRYLLTQIRARGVRDFSFYKVLNFDDLSLRPGASENARFRERYMKDLTKINPDLSRVLLVEDMKEFSAPGQEKNLYWLGKTYSYSVDFAGASPTDPYAAPTLQEWRQERNKIADFYKFFQKIAGPAICSKVLSVPAAP